MTEQPPLVRAIVRLRDTFWQRRFLYGTLRAIWLALLVPTVVMAGYLFLGWQIRWELWVAPMLLVAAVVLIWSLRPLTLEKMTRRLDGLMDRRSQLTTALEVSFAANHPAYLNNPVAGRLIQDAVETTVGLRQQVKVLGRGFWLELNMLIGVASVLGALILLDMLAPVRPNAALVDLPLPFDEPRADEVIPPDPQLRPPPFQQQLQTMTPEQVQAALEALADALRDQAASRPAAEALDQGNLGQAAAELRRLADQLGGLSEQAQQGLGQSLQEAADNIGGNAPGFTEPLRQGNETLQSGDLAGAAQALEDLADLLDELGEQQPEGGQAEGEAGDSGEGEAEGEPGETESEQGGEQPGGGGEGAGDGEGSEGESELGEEEERLPIDGEPLELESEEENIEDRVLQPSELEAGSDSDKRTTDSPFARQPLNAAGEELGPDPLAYPWEKREIIRDYFSD
ncbi:MAG TPA: hypothetical protein PKD98_28475 [Anaerolineae bacterium]|nr:hypothetical protein [Anaerolineae bacterium]